MTTETISKATFIYYSEKAENNLKLATLKTLEEGMKDGVDKYDMMKILAFASMDYGLKNELLSGGFRDLDAFKVIVESLIDHLVTEDPDIQRAIKGYHKIAKSQSK
jgi:hypothetical protein